MPKPVKRANRRGIGPEMLSKIERLVELNEAHFTAICGGDQSFYTDGRHEELVNLIPVVHSALGIRPWHDADPILQEALEAARGE